TRRVHFDAPARGLPAAAQVGRVDHGRRPRLGGVDLRDKSEIVLAGADRLDGAGRDGEPGGGVRDPGDVDIPSRIDGDAVPLVRAAAAQETGVKQHRIDDQRLAPGATTKSYSSCSWLP